MVVGLGSKESLTQNKKDKKMNIKTPVVLLLCLSMGCSTTRSAAGGFSLATGIATGISTIALTGVAASNDYSGGSVLPMVGSIAGSALLSTTFLTLAGYLLGSEGICAQELAARTETARVEAAEAVRSEEAELSRYEEAIRIEGAEICRRTPNGIAYPWRANSTIGINNRVHCINGVAHH
jgi:hypothetical protein